MLSFRYVSVIDIPMYSYWEISIFLYLNRRTELKENWLTAKKEKENMYLMWYVHAIKIHVSLEFLNSCF